MSRKRDKNRLNVNEIMGESSKELILLNVGILQDVPTATFKVGDKGETIMLAGLDISTAFVGPGNSYKSTLAFYMFLTILDRYADFGSIYDSEINMKRQRIINLAKSMSNLHGDLEDDFDSVINLQSKSKMFADEWFNNFKKLCEKNATTKPIKCDGLDNTMINVLVSLMDSITEAEPKISNDMLGKANVEDSSTNTYFMRSGLFKTKMVGEIPTYSFKGNNRFILTAHTGQKLGIGENKYSKPDKMLKELKDDEIIKGVSSKFSFLISTVYKNSGASLLKNQTTKLPEFPTKQGNMYDVDLSIVKIKVLRCKSGATGLTSPIIVSQTEGVLQSLTEFNFIKKKDYHPIQGADYGISGSNTNYHLDILPNINLSRTTIRDKIDGIVGSDNKLLVRAINITSELLQMDIYHGNAYKVPKPKELYDKLKEYGYDWNELLDTRGWYHPENYNVKEFGNPLSIVDFINMYHGTYIPFWLEKNKYKEIEEKVKNYVGKS